MIIRIFETCNVELGLWRLGSSGDELDIAPSADTWGLRLPEQPHLWESVDQFLCESSVRVDSGSNAGRHMTGLGSQFYAIIIF